MKDPLAIIAANVSTLTEFSKRYPNVWRYLFTRHDICASKIAPPCISIDGQDEDAKRAVIDAFGAIGWTEAEANGVLRTVERTVEGVHIRIFQAYRIEPVDSCKPKEVPAHLLTGREAGIDLLSSEVRDVKPLFKSLFKSFAEWPAETYTNGSGEHISTDTHYSRAAAEAICSLLHRDGFGGDRKSFPIRTWVEGNRGGVEVSKPATELIVEKQDWIKIPPECRLFGMEIQYEPDAIHDILSLKYFSALDVVLYEYREPFTSAPVLIQDFGLDRFRFYLRFFKGKVKRKKFWMRSRSGFIARNKERAS